MESSNALAAFAALSQEMRLAALRALVAAGPEGMTAGALARQLGARPNTLSANLAALAGADLVRAQREGRQIRYFPRLDTLGALIAFLTNDCCGGNPSACPPLASSESPHD